ncbi:MAG: purine permease [Clostridia bacterium]|nr:purine permease [Clostridia bacterium]
MENKAVLESGIVPVYDQDDKPPLKEAIPLGLQHVFAMFVGNITVPVIVAGVLGMSVGETAFFLQCALFAAGVATFIQINRIGPIGSRLPIIMGTSFAIIAPSIAIGTQYGMSAVMGASLIAGLVQAVAGYFLKYIKHLFAPVVTGTVLLAIGLSLMPTGIDYAAGGVGAADYGSMSNWFLAGLVLLVIIICNNFLKGFIRMAAILIGLIVGYLVAIPMGKVDFSAIAEAGWFSLPTPFYFGFSFEWSSIALMSIVLLAVMVETIGNVTGITVGGAGREPSEEELSGGVVADGLATSVATLFNALPNTCYSQNVGVVSFTGVMSRWVVAIAGIILLIAGLFPKIGAVIAVMPASVLGGAAIVMFAMIATAGISLLSQTGLDRRSLFIIAVALGLGFGVGLRPDSLQQFPESVSLIFGGSGIVLTALTALILNVVLPKEEAE